MRLHNTLVTIGFAFLAATSLFRLLLAGLLANLLLGIAVWLAASSALMVSLMVATRWTLRIRQRAGPSLILPMATDHTTPETTEIRRAA